MYVYVYVKMEYKSCSFLSPLALFFLIVFPFFVTIPKRSLLRGMCIMQSLRRSI